MNMKNKFLEKKANYLERNCQIELAICKLERINEFCGSSLLKTFDDYLYKQNWELLKTKRARYVLLARFCVILFNLKFGFTTISGQVCDH